MATYILDTNVLLHDARALYAFHDATVVIPLDVLDELDRYKKNPNEVGRNAREVIRVLDRARRGGSLPEGVPINGGTLRVLIDYLPENVPAGMDLHVVDNRISVIDPANGFAVSTLDLNAHIDRQSDPATNLAERSASISQPGMMAWNASPAR